MNGYQIFLMIELARLYNIIDVNLEYDLMYGKGGELYSEFEKSTFNVDTKSEYDCIVEFLKDKATRNEGLVIKHQNASIPRVITEQQAKDTLEKMGYQVDNLWHIDDVKSRFECTDEEAMDVLIAALNNETTFEQIWYALEYEAEDEMGLTRIEEDGESDLDI
jgi:hypothetical protein